MPRDDINESLFTDVTEGESVASAILTEIVPRIRELEQEIKELRQPLPGAPVMLDWRKSKRSLAFVIEVLREEGLLHIGDHFHEVAAQHFTWQGQRILPNDLAVALNAVNPDLPEYRRLKAKIHDAPE